MNKATFEWKIEIEFWFVYHEDLDKLSIEERELLEKQAKESIFHFIAKDGYTAGELCESIDVREFYGWWNYRITNK